MAPRRGNLAALAATRLVIVASGLVVQVALPRWLPREDFATYRWVWACCAVVAVGGNLGLWQLLTRRVARDEAEAGRLLPVALRAAALTSLLTGVLVTAYVATRDPRPAVVLAGALGAATLAANAGAQLVQATFHGLRRMTVELPWVLAGRLLFVATQLGLAATGFGLAALYGGRLAAAALTLVGLLLAWRRLVPRVHAPAGGREVLAWVAEARSFGPAVLFGAVAAQADVLMLEAMTDPGEVARYAAPAGVLLQLALLATILTRTFFPTVSRLVIERPEALPGELALQVRLQLLVAAPIAVGGVIVAGSLVTTLFGAAYADAAGPLVALLLAVPVRFLNNAYGLTLTAIDAQPDRARIDLLGAVINVVANLWAIPRYGAVGAAATTLLTDLAVHGLLRWRIARTVPGAFEVGPMLRTLLPAAGMGLVVAAWPDGDLWARVALGAASYAAFAWFTGGWRRADLGRLARI